MAFPPTQNPFSEVALIIAVINGSAISCSDINWQVVLQSRHEARPLPKRLDVGKSYDEINCSGSFSDVIWVEELHKFAKQLRILKLIHIITLKFLNL
jgi:hypothetical protein